MNRYYKSLILITLFIGACGAESRRDGGNHDAPISPRDQPELLEYHLVDTYGVNTEFDSEELALSPFVNNGEFEVFWRVFSDYDYFVEVRFNTAPTTDRSRLISSDFCGPGLYCDTHQYQFCDYTSNFDIRCESSSGDIQSEYIGDMLETIPQIGYVILQVCDTSFFYCEYDSLPVLME